ncbi:MAG: sphingomyelin phosphodiesterase [archaeon]|nr:sphingomyelin phosphodiesterase [archaeon]
MKTLCLFFYLSLIFAVHSASVKSYSKSKNQIPATAMTKEEYDLINNTADLFIKEVIKSTQTPKLDSAVCSLCEGAVSLIHKLVNSETSRSAITVFINKICSTFVMDKEVCDAAVANYGPVVLDNLIERGLGPHRICEDLKICDITTPRINIEDYADRVLKDMPEVVEKKIDKDSTETLKVLQVTDIHFDDSYKEGTVVDCGRPLCCRDYPKEGEEGVTLAGFYGTIAGCDANIEAVKTFSDQIPKLGIDYILFTGDNIAHEVWSVKQEDVIKATKKIIDTMVAKIGMNIPIIPAIGNHEKAPVDQYGKNETYLLEGISEVFKPWLPEDAYESFRQYGYYSMKYKDTNLRFIVLNCLVCDAFNFNLLTETSQAKKMFDWFEGELSKAEKNGEFVHVIDHIPVGNHQQNIQCGLRMKILMERYQNIIRAYFSGHTHKDEIKIVRGYRNTKPLHVNYVSAGLTTFSEYNPSFRVFEVDKKSMLLKDFITYRLDINKSNADRTPHWYEAYRAFEFLNHTNLYDAEGVSKINIAGDYLIHCYTETQKAYDVAYDEKQVKSAYCSFAYDTYKEQMECSGEGKGFTEPYMHYIMSLISGSWKEENKLSYLS